MSLYEIIANEMSVNNMTKYKIYMDKFTVLKDVC